MAAYVKIRQPLAIVGWDIAEMSLGILGVANTLSWLAGGGQLVEIFYFRELTGIYGVTLIWGIYLVIHGGAHVLRDVRLAPRFGIVPVGDGSEVRKWPFGVGTRIGLAPGDKLALTLFAFHRGGMAGLARSKRLRVSSERDAIEIWVRDVAVDRVAHDFQRLLPNNAVEVVPDDGKREPPHWWE